MKKAFAVIGVGFGDEGKGLTTDFLVRKHSVGIVARNNGGAQAGHTVVTAFGERHVFGHIGAGHFAGARTYLGSNFIINPILLNKERSMLSCTPWDAVIYASPKCKVTTIFDMALNGLLELSRKNRHGSCGVGINETVTRHEAGFKLTFSEIRVSSAPMLFMELRKIFNQYWKPRANQLIGMTDFPEEANDLLAVFEDPDFHKIAIELKDTIMNISNVNPSIMFPDNLVVEGAQGLMLDEFLGDFPHVTRSITGLPSALLAAHELNHDSITPIYVTRAYTTRHGAGKLPAEGQPITTIEIPADKTNATNKWQGNFRYAPLNLHQIKRFIEQDLQRSCTVAQVLGVKINPPEIMVTCMDQLGDEVSVYEYAGQLNTYKVEELAALIENTVGYKVKYQSFGETADHVKEL